MTFDEAKHRRAPKGSREGGEFTAGEWHDVDESDYKELGDLSEEELDGLRDATIYNPSNEEIGAVTAYCDESYEAINAALRSGEDLGEAAGIVDELDSVFSKSSLKQNIATFRDVTPEFAATLKTMKLGDRIKDGGFLSTSTDPKMEIRWGSGVKMKILIPKGSEAVIPGSWSGLSSDEDEVILPRGGTYRYLRMSGNNHLFLYQAAS